MHKHSVENVLPGIVSGGVIVEIGGGKGDGARAMAGCATDPIVVVDPFLPYKDELGGEYGPETKAAFLDNIKGVVNKSGRAIGLLERTAEAAVVDWRSPVSLLWIDLSTTPEHLEAIIRLWEPFVVDTIAIAGLEWDKLKVREVADRILPLGFEDRTDQDAVAILKRVHHNRAAFYICSTADNGRYIVEAMRSVQRVHTHMGIPCHLFLQGEWDHEIVGFDHIHPLPDQKGPFWYLDSTRYFVQALEELRDYKEVVYFDVDTCCCAPCLNIFDVLRQYDLAVGQSPMRDAIESTSAVPESFCTLEIGVMVMRNIERVRAFTRDWLRRYEEGWQTYDNNDQAPFRDALWENDTIRWVALAPEWGLRFDFSAWVMGVCRIVHGRIGGFSVPDPQTICDQINERTTMRIWHKKLLPSTWVDEWDK